MTPRVNHETTMRGGHSAAIEKVLGFPPTFNHDYHRLPRNSPTPDLCGGTEAEL